MSRITSSTRRVLLAMSAAGLLGAAACGAGQAAGTSVEMRLVAFRPEAVSLDAGGSVVWEQDDPGVHTVTSGVVEPAAAGVVARPDGEFASGDLQTGDSFTHTFADPGTFAYFCEVHPATMQGRVTVR